MPFFYCGQMNRTLDPDLVLHRGAHHNRDDGMCLLEAVAFLADETHSDEPACVSPLLINFGQALNDNLNGTARQALKPLAPRLIGTADDGKHRDRPFLALDWVTRTVLPAWMHAADHVTPAADLRGLPSLASLGVASRLTGDVEVILKDFFATDPLPGLTLAARCVTGLVRQQCLAEAGILAADMAAEMVNWNSGEPWRPEFAAAGNYGLWGAVRVAVSTCIFTLNFADECITDVVTELQRSAVDLFARMIDA